MNEEADVWEARLARGNENIYITPAFYFDLLPTDVLNHILRFFSALPDAKRWENHIRLNDIVGLFSETDDCFADFMNNRFNTLCISNTIDCSYEKKTFLWHFKRKRMLCTNDVKLASEFVLAGGGKYLHSLLVGSNMETEGMVDVFSRENCPNLTSLSVYDNRSNWIPTFGDQLTKLECRNLSSPFTMHCANLKEINIDVGSSRIFDEITVSTSLREQVGASLEILILTRASKTRVEEFYKIAEYCRKLKGIVIPVIRSQWGAALGKLLASYGVQLRWAVISSLNEAQLSRWRFQARMLVFVFKPS